MAKNLKIVIWLFIILSFLFMLFSLSDAIGVSWDSVNYFASARNFLEGRGFMTPMLFWHEEGSSKPLTHYPPFYSFILALIIFLGVDPLSAAILLSSLLFGLNLLLTSFIVFKITKSNIATLLVLCFCLCSRSFIGIHFAALSDSLFMFLLLLYLLVLLNVKNDNSINAFLLLAIISALAVLTRYVGVTLIAASSAVLLLLKFEKGKKKIFLFGYLFISTLPFMFWLLRNRLLAGNAFNREFIYRIGLPYKIQQMLGTIMGWLIPDSLSLNLRISIGLLILISVLVVLLIANKNKHFIRNSLELNWELKYFSFFCLFFDLIYIAFLLFSVAFFDAGIPFDNRMMAPVYIINIIFFMTWFVILKKNNFLSNIIAKILLIFLGLIFISNCCYNVFNFRRHLPEFVEHGFSYPQWNDYRWNNSKIIDFLSKQKKNTVIFSNAQDLIYFKTGKPAYDLLRKKNISKLDSFLDKAEATQGLIVYFEDIGRSYFVDKELLLSERENSIIFEDQTGTIFTYE